MYGLVPVLAYLIGSIPTAYIAGRITRGVDIRCLGDGNVGMQNAFHQLGKKIGLLVGLIDIGKGAAVILIAQAAGSPELIVMLTGITAIIGHNWPVFLGFRGGRGESVTVGVLFVILTVPMLLVSVPGAISMLLRRNVILTAAFMFIPLPLACWWVGVSGDWIAYGTALPCMVGLTTYLRTRHALVCVKEEPAHRE